MTQPKRILITGAAGFWGQRLIELLLPDPDWDVIGLDGLVPQPIPAGLTFRQYDMRGPTLTEVVQELAPDVICHLGFLFEPAGAATHDYNVTGAMNLIQAAVAAGVEQLILKSSTMVYGAYADNPAFLTEGHKRRGQGAAYIDQWRRIEGFAEASRPTLNGLKLAVLRFANVIGPGVDSPFMRLLHEPAAPTLLGFNPLLQVIHLDDVLAALQQALAAGADGVFNIGAPEPMPLSRLLALAGRTRLPLLHRLVYGGVGKQPLPPDYLRYRWVADTGRMTDELNFYPTLAAADAVRGLRRG